MKKKKKPIIGVVGRVSTSLSGDNTICVWEEIRLSIVKSGGIPLLILPTDNAIYVNNEKHDLTAKEKVDLYSIVDLCDGLLFQGGLSWNLFDIIIFKYGLEKDMPMLGICAGMQMMACVDKYNTSNDLTILNNTLINHKSKNEYVHKVKVINKTLLYDIVNKNILDVNSRHSYHIDGVKNFIVSAYSEDGFIEAIEYPNKKFVLGVQWHPESLFDKNKEARAIFFRFLKICQKSALFG